MTRTSPRNALKPMARALRRFRPPSEIPSASSSYRMLSGDAPNSRAAVAWHNVTVAARQDAAWRHLVAGMHAGNPRSDLQAAAAAVQLTGERSPLLLEIGCGTAYYSEILACLVDMPIRYVGLDYSLPMVYVGKQRSRVQTLVAGDARQLPFAARSFDVVLNGAALMHTFDYRRALEEQYRVARRWSIFHTVIVSESAETIYLEKLAYGMPVVEVIFNLKSLYQIVEEVGFRVCHELDSIDYDLYGEIGIRTKAKTIVCRVAN